MEINEEDKLILNGEMFYCVRSYIRQKKPSADIVAKIEELVNQGADINTRDKNDNDHTILHVAVQKEEKDVVSYLLQKGVSLFQIQDKRTALNLALKINTPTGKEIADILSKHIDGTAEGLSVLQTKSERVLQNNSVISKVCDQDYTYPKRAGTSGVSGQFYETKLLSLVLHRALHDKDIKEFYLAANIKDIGDFDDVCFRYEDVACFMQTKHRENTDKAKLTVASVRSNTGKLGLGIYFDSFLKIKQKFSTNTTDPMFQGKYEDIDSYFVLYTPLKESFDKKLSGNKQVRRKLHDIIYTGEKEINKKNKGIDIFQFDYESRDLDFLTKFIKHEHMKVLGKTFLEFILSNNKLEAMMASDLIKIYHPALSQQVISISKVLEAPKVPKSSKTQNIENVKNNSRIPNYIHVGNFRSDFFESDNYNLITLKDTFFREIVYSHSTKSGLTKDEIKEKIQNIIEYPCAETISQLIGSPIKFDDTNDKLSLDISKLPKNMFKQDEIQQIKFGLQSTQVTRTMVRDAVYLAGQRKLETLSFQLPKSFGNIDLTTNQKTIEGVHSRLDFLAGKLEKLITYYAKRNKDKETKVIDINNDVVGPGKILEYTHLNSNGGIGGAVGNLLEFDTQSELFTFNTTCVLGDNAKYVLEKLKKLTSENFNNYKINVTIDGFPRNSFDVYQYDKNIAADFLSKLWFYTNQSQEESVEITIKEEINLHYNNADKQRNQCLFHVHSDAIFLRFHDKIQKWWKRQTDAQYLTKNTTLFEDAKKDIVDSPLLTVLNVMFVRKINTFGVEFNTNAVEMLCLDDFIRTGKNKTLNIVSDCVILSALKIMQFNKIMSVSKFTFINLDYVHILPRNDYETMIEELRVIKDVTLVIISEAPINQDLQGTLLKIVEPFTENLEFSKKQIIIITCKPLQTKHKELFQNYECNSLIDNNINFIDLTAQSQTLCLDKCEIIYQGRVIKLDQVIDENAKDFIDAKLLWSFLNKENIEIGRTLDTQKYKEIKNCYINRNLKRKGKTYEVNSLDDLDNRFVLVSSKPCMGKTVLLTHLALETKKADPKLWIVHIDLSVYVKELNEITKKDIKSVMTLLCKAALNKTDNLKSVNFTEIDNEAIAISSESPKNISFELQLFIQLYNNDNVIFLFDGFDKIYPQNTNEGLELLTTLKKSNKRMWITSDCYVIKILERHFGSSYKLERLTTVQQKNFLERFWSTNLQLEKLNHEQSNNIIVFLNYILRLFNRKVDVGNKLNDRPIMPLLSVPLHLLYITLLEHFKNEAQSLSPCYFREKLKKKWRLNSYTAADRYFRTCEENESLELTGTPLHMYIAANYFAFQITDRFDLHLDTQMIVDKSNVYINAVTLYERFLKKNIKTICEIENKSAVNYNQDRLRDHFFENHKKLALYAIYKENDLSKILTESEIIEVKKTIHMIESGEIKTDLIDSVVNGIPRFYHLLFAEYYIVETLSDLLKRMKNNDFKSLQLVSFWDFLVNVVLVSSPPTLRNAFEYKLKYDPEIEEVVNNDNCKRVIFDLLVKPDQASAVSTSNGDTAVNIAINEGLTNITDLLLNNIKKHVDESSAECVSKVIQASASVLGAVDPSRQVLSDNVLKCMQDIDGKSIVATLNSNKIGNDIQNTIQEKIVEPVKKLTEKVVEASGNNENLVKLVEQLPHHLPDIVRALFKKK